MAHKKSHNLKSEQNIHSRKKMKKRRKIDDLLLLYHLELPKIS